MARASNAHLKLLGLAALGFGLACVLFLIRTTLAVGMLDTVCETTAYLLLAAAVVSLSYGVFLRSWQQDQKPRGPPA